MSKTFNFFLIKNLILTFFFFQISFFLNLDFFVFQPFSSCQRILRKFRVSTFFEFRFFSSFDLSSCFDFFEFRLFSCFDFFFVCRSFSSFDPLSCLYYFRVSTFFRFLIFFFHFRPFLRFDPFQASTFSCIFSSFLFSNKYGLTGGNRHYLSRSAFFLWSFRHVLNRTIMMSITEKEKKCNFRNPKLIGRNSAQS